MGNQRASIDPSEDLTARLRQAYARFASSFGRDFEGFIDLMTDDFAYQAPIADPPRPQYFRSNIGREGMRTYFETLLRDWKMVEYEPVEFATGRAAIAMRGHCEWMYRRTGKTVVTMEFNWWQVRDSRLCALYHCFDTAGMLEAIRP